MATAHQLLTVGIWKGSTEDEDARPATPEEVSQHVKIVVGAKPGQYVLACDPGYFLETY